MEGEGDEQQHKRSKPTNNPSLPQELITEILVRLPVKYLLQYKCVSKDWLSLISSPQFVKTHLSLSANDHTRHRVLLKGKKDRPREYNLKHCSVSSLFKESVTEAFDLDYSLRSTCRSLCIVGSVNGLICLCIGSDVLVLWNPSTRKFKQVPASILTTMSGYTYAYGFGYDEVHDDYKILALFFSIKNGYNISEIYNLKSDSWRRLDDFQGGMLTTSCTKLANGKLHWKTYGADVFDIVSFDLVDEKWRKVEQPCYGKGNFNLGVLGSDLSVLYNYLGAYRTTHVWVMKNYGVKESWTKLYTIEYPEDSDVLSTPICMSNKGELLLLSKSNLTVYNPEDKSLRHPVITGVDDRLEAELYIESLDGLEAEFYIESLVCPILQTEPMTQFEGNKKSRF